MSVCCVCLSVAVCLSVCLPAYMTVCMRECCRTPFSTPILFWYFYIVEREEDRRLWFQTIEIVFSLQVFQCNHCEATYTDASNLSRHKKRVSIICCDLSVLLVNSSFSKNIACDSANVLIMLSRIPDYFVGVSTTLLLKFQQKCNWLPLGIYFSSLFWKMVFWTPSLATLA